MWHTQHKNPKEGRQPGHDKLTHVRPIISILLHQTKQEYSPYKEMSVDETMDAYTGRRPQTVCPLEAHKTRDKSLDEGRF